MLGHMGRDLHRPQILDELVGVVILIPAQGAPATPPLSGRWATGTERDPEGAAECPAAIDDRQAHMPAAMWKLELWRRSGCAQVNVGQAPRTGEALRILKFEVL
jgi:hypothetical protein